MKKLFFIANSLILAVPFIAMATDGATTIKTIIIEATTVVKLLINLLMPLAVAIFIWGVVKYIYSSGDEDKRKTAKSYIVYGLIGLFVLITFVGIIQILASTLGVSTGGWFGTLLPQANPNPSGNEGFNQGIYTEQDY